MCAVFGARLPHSTALVPGGATQRPTEERYLTYLSRLKRVQEFVENVYLPDILAAAKAFPQYWDAGAGYGHLLAYGVFEDDDSGRRLFSPGASSTAATRRWMSTPFRRMSAIPAFPQRLPFIRPRDRRWPTRAKPRPIPGSRPRVQGAAHGGRSAGARAGRLSCAAKRGEKRCRCAAQGDRAAGRQDEFRAGPDSVPRHRASDHVAPVL